MAQIHSYYITNAKSELKFSSSNMSEDELESILQEITMAMLNNDDLFVEEDDDDAFLDNESINLDEEDANANDLLMGNIMNLDDFREQNEVDIDLNILRIQDDEPVNNDSNIDFEAILNEELGDL